MSIKTVIVTDGITSETRTLISAPVEAADLTAFVTENNQRATFDGRVAPLEHICRRTPGRRGHGKEPVFGSRAWYADEILLAISAVRHWLKTGHADVAAAEAMAVGALAAEAVARHHWPIVQLGIKNRKSTQAAGRERGKQTTRTAKELDRQILDTINRYKTSDERLTVRKLAQILEVSEKTIQRHRDKMGITLP